MTACILIIDASVNRCVQTVAKLATTFPDPITVESVDRALPRIRLQPPDLIILGTDPYHDPGTALRRIRSDPAGLGMPIIAIGDGAKRSMGTGLLRLGADVTLPDTCSGADLCARIENLLQRRDQLRQSTPDSTTRLWAMSESAKPFAGKGKVSGD